MRRQSMLLVSLILSLFPFIAQAQQSQYNIKQDDPSTGTNLKRAVVNSGLPINKRYEQFTDEEKASLAQLYERLDEGDEPPFPKAGLRPIFEALRKAEDRYQARGDLSLIATIDANGDVTEVKSIGTLDASMVNFAASLLMLTKFKPAKCKGEACTMQYPFRMNFELVHIR